MTAMRKSHEEEQEKLATSDDDDLRLRAGALARD